MSIKAFALGDGMGSRAACDFVNHMLVTMPQSHDLLDCCGVALAKTADDVRPIAMGETWVKVASLAAVHSCSDIADTLLPLQLAVGVPGWAQCVGHALRTGLQHDAHYVTVSTDTRNAFNTVDRSAIFASVQIHEPQILPFVK